MFERLLIANRGEIAVRVIRSARELGLATLAVYSDADRDALHVRLADEAYHLGAASPAQSYLNAERLIEVARKARADAIHPGYGFLAENADFARAVIDAGIVWVGPLPSAMAVMGDKLRARETMRAAGVPVVPGSESALGDAAEARAAAQRYGFPLALKASGGGGGKGLKIARNAGEIESAFTTAQREAQAYFGNPTIYAERYLENPKHIELQILADKHGTVLHLGERDCSLQRRHQKLWEEAPAQIPDRVRSGLRQAGVRAAEAIGYDSAGTIEALLSGDEFYFLEMNTRIQVEHTVTEMITGIDIVREQLRVAAGERLAFSQDQIVFSGHAIEARINAEDPSANFRAAPGTLQGYREPGGPGVRVDSAAYPGFVIASEYDSLIAKLIVWAPDRTAALQRLRRCLDEYAIEGVPTTLGFLRALSDHPPVVENAYSTNTLEEFASSFSGEARESPAAPPPARVVKVDKSGANVEVNGKLFRVNFPDGVPGTLRTAPPRARVKRKESSAAGNAILSPMHGVVVELMVEPEKQIAEGDVVAVIEAMKMMNEVRAHRSGAVGEIHVSQGQTVEAGSPICSLL